MPDENLEDDIETNEDGEIDEILLDDDDDIPIEDPFDDGDLE